MHPRSLDVFDNRRDQSLVAVTDGVHLHLLASDILVDQHRVLGTDLYRRGHVAHQVLGVLHHFHRPASQDVRRAYQHRVTQFLGHRNRLVCGHHRLALGLGDTQTPEQTLEAPPVLGGVDPLHTGAQDRGVVVGQVAGQVDGRLATKLYHHSVRLLLVDHVEHVLRSQGLEVELVGSIEVGADRFRVVVDDQPLHPGLLQRPDSVDRAVVELDSLANADRPGTQHDHPLPPRGRRLVLLVVGAVEVGGCRPELGGAGVHHLIDRGDARLPAQGTDDTGLPPGQLGDLVVGEAQPLALPQQVRGQVLPLQPLLVPDDMTDLVQEPAVDLAQVVDLP